ncbi:small acid-soluble spore protein SspI [Solibacillus sp. FSL H8-0538]|uniref:small acid-soluble spore protein SspI n=1 Tax=Solibacillus sp. FSL H8-0538 TaxID=2921400 RepID=UPI0030F828B7
MDFQIRQAITSNVTGQTAEEFTDIVADAIDRGEEHLLPGLGVFLEKWWTSASDAERQAFSQKLAQNFAS